jgi:hypothetical protein
MNNNIIENFTTDIPNSTYTDFNGTDFNVLSVSAREKIDALITEGIDIDDDKWTELYRNQDYFGLSNNHIIECGAADMGQGAARPETPPPSPATECEEDFVYKMFDFSAGISDPKLRYIMNKMNGLWNININKVVEEYGDLNDGNIILCGSLSDKTKALTLHFLSDDVSPSEAGGTKVDYNQELRCRCKNGICYSDHLDKFKYPDSISPSSIREKASKRRSQLSDGNLSVKVTTSDDWYPGYFINDSCIDSGFSEPYDIFKTNPVDETTTQIEVFNTTLDPYHSESHSQNSWYIDFSECLFGIEMIANLRYLLKVYENNDIRSNLVFYCDFMIIDADTGNNPALYAILHRGPNQKYYNVENASNIRTDKHESCIVKIYIDRYGNLVFSDNIIFPSLILRPSNPTMGCNPAPKTSSFGAFNLLLFNVSNKILNQEKIRLGRSFEVYDFGSNEDFPLEIRNNLITTLGNIYDLVFDYIPTTTLSNGCDQPENEEEDEEEESNFVRAENPSISTLIEEFLYLHCNGATLDQPPEYGKFSIYKLVKPEHNRMNLVDSIYNSVVESEKDTFQFCRNTELGRVQPNDLVKKAGLHHTMLLDVGNFVIPTISNQYSEEDFVFKCNNNICVQNKSNVRYLLSLPEGIDEQKYCDLNNFENKEDILGKCNVENKNLLTHLCSSYSTPIGTVGYPHRCSISDLNNLTEYCEENYNPNCQENPYARGCNIQDGWNNPTMEYYPGSYKSSDGSVIELGGNCGNIEVISNEMELIDSQSRTNKEQREIHENYRDSVLELADSLNASHAFLSSNHEETIRILEEQSEDTTRMRVCNAQKRKYDFETKTCTNEFLQFSMDDTNPEYYKCEQARLDFEEKGKFRLYLFLFVFIIIFSISFYFIFLR